MKFIKQARTGSASSGPLWFPLNTTSSLAVKGSIGATLDDGGGGIEGGGGLGGGGDVTPNAVNWTDMASNEGTGEVGYSSVQITGIDTDITLNVSSVTGGGLYYKISDSQVTGIIINLNTEGYTAIPSAGGNIGPVANNKWVTIANAMGNSMGHNTTVTVRNVTDNNAVLDSFVVTFIAGGGCLLTTAVVEYFGLADDGPELTAMRALRSHYAGVEGYAAIIQEYYASSPGIIAAIQAAEAEDAEYTALLQVIQDIKDHVADGQWQQAHDIYMNAYTDLKLRYSGA